MNVNLSRAQAQALLAAGEYRDTHWGDEPPGDVLELRQALARLEAALEAPEVPAWKRTHASPKLRRRRLPE